MTDELLFYIVIAVIGSTLVAWIARSQGRSPTTWFGISILLSPLIGFVAVILTAPRKEAAPVVAPMSPVGPRQGLTSLRPGAGCPRCGTIRSGQQRYCPSCAFDYWEAAAPAPTPTQPAAAAAPAKRSNLPLAPLLGIALVVIGGLYIASQVFGDGEAPGSASSSALPPAGEIWFGESFDTETFELSGRTDTVGTTETFAFVGTLPRSVQGDELSIRAAWNGQQVFNDAANVEGSGDVFGFTYGPLFEPGTWTIEIADVGGNVLASGSVEAE